MPEVKKLLKLGAANVIGRFLHHDMCNRVVVLCYHSIHPCKTFASATPDLFRSHLYWLRQNCDVIRFQETQMASRTRSSGHPRVAITFDDGYEDNYEFAFRLIDDAHLPVTFFLTGGLLENDAHVISRFQRERRSRYQDIRPLSWSQVREMMSTGLEFGAHTYTHRNLAHCNHDIVRLELQKGKQVIEQRIGQEVISVAYPYGKPGRAFNLGTIREVAAAGYRYAAAVLFRGVRHSDSEFAIPRFFVARDDIATLKAKIWGEWDNIGWWQEKAPEWLTRVISPEDYSSNDLWNHKLTSPEWRP